jgi:hypothetical protein
MVKIIFESDNGIGHESEPGKLDFPSSREM